MFSHLIDCLFLLFMVSFAVRDFLVQCTFIYLSFLLFPMPEATYWKKILLWEMWGMSKVLLFMLSSRIFMVLSLTFKSLIHFEFISGYGIRTWSYTIHNCSNLAHMCSIFWTLLNRLSIGYWKKNPLCVFASFVKY